MMKRYFLFLISCYEWMGRQESDYGIGMFYWLVSIIITPIVLAGSLLVGILSGSAMQILTFFLFYGISSLLIFLILTAEARRASSCSTRITLSLFWPLYPIYRLVP